MKDEYARDQIKQLSAQILQLTEIAQATNKQLISAVLMIHELQDKNKGDVGL